MPEPDAGSILGLSTVVAIAAAVGGIIAEVAKTIFSNYFLTKRTEKQEIKRVFDKYKNPIALSATELANRFIEINQLYPTTFLSLKYLNSKLRKVTANSDTDEYFRKYKLVSTLYRFCAFLGWLEIYRRDTVFLASGDLNKDSQLDKCLTKFRSAISDGHLNSFQNWHTWVDHLIFREELRAVGESMISSASSDYQVMGYADFERLLADKNSNGHRWLNSTMHFFIDPQSNNDFRKIRFCLILTSLCDLIAFSFPI